MGLDVTNVAASLAMSAENSNAVASDSSSNSKQNPSTTSGVTSAAVQAAAQQVLQNRVAQAQQVTGVALPSFYNPAAVNPMKYAQQIQKRKLLWSNKVGFGFISCPLRLLIVFDSCVNCTGEKWTTGHINSQAVGINSLHARPRWKNDSQVQTPDGHQTRPIWRR